MFVVPDNEEPSALGDVSLMQDRKGTRLQLRAGDELYPRGSAPSEALSSSTISTKSASVNLDHEIVLEIVLVHAASSDSSTCTSMSTKEMFENRAR